MEIIKRSDIKNLNKNFMMANVSKQGKVLVDVYEKLRNDLKEISKHQDQMVEKIVDMYKERVRHINDPKLLLNLSQEERSDYFQEGIRMCLAVENIKEKDDQRKERERSETKKMITILGLGSLSIAALPRIIKEIGKIITRIK